MIISLLHPYLDSLFQRKDEGQRWRVSYAFLSLTLYLLLLLFSFSATIMSLTPFTYLDSLLQRALVLWGEVGDHVVELVDLTLIIHGELGQQVRAKLLCQGLCCGLHWLVGRLQGRKGKDTPLQASSFWPSLWSVSETVKSSDLSMNLNAIQE